MLRELLASLYLRLGRWELVGEVPGTSAVIIGAPHTSNWDFPKLVAAKWKWRFRPRWIGKHTLFRRPFGALFRRMGGIPVNRERPGHLVEQMASLFASQVPVHLVITPEGTRSPAPYWKSGFYHIARRANVPVVTGFVDYGKRRFGLGATVELTGDVVSDMNGIRRFYQDKRGRRPENQGPIRLAEEER